MNTHASLPRIPQEPRHPRRPATPKPSIAKEAVPTVVTILGTATLVLIGAPLA